jgi:uncharacterized protein YacL
LNNEPDKLEKSIRFGCGGVLGLLLGLYVSVRIFIDLENKIIPIAIVFITIILCGFAAMKKGDRFWDFLKGWLVWW